MPRANCSGWTRCRWRARGGSWRSLPPKDADRALSLMRRHECGAGAGWIGAVEEGDPPLVVLKSAIGASRILDMASGEQLPRIC